MRKHLQQGFTLVELSIVLVIVGLVIGGTLVGKDLIRNAELSSVAKQIDGYNASINIFRDRFNSMPGDMSNATNYWGEADGDRDTCYEMDKTNIDLGTCNGNGDGRIGGVDYKYGTVDYDGEMYLVWHHLMHAELLDQIVNGQRQASSDYIHVVGENCPVSKLDGTVGYGLRNAGIYGPPSGSSSSWFNGYYGHIMMLGAEETGGTNLPRRPAFTPEEQYSIDFKLDDGRPGQGIIVSRTGTGGSGNWADCTQISEADDSVTDNTHIDAVYKVDYPDIACVLIYRKITE